MPLHTRSVFARCASLHPRSGFSPILSPVLKSACWAAYVQTARAVHTCQLMQYKPVNFMQYRPVNFRA